MKKFLLILFVLVLASMVMSGCGKTEKTTSPTPTTTSTTKAGEPQYGGTLKIIASYVSSNVGYPPNDSPLGMGQDCTRRLITWDINGNVIPDLAVSWDLDKTNNTLTWHLVQGAKFYDGTPFNAAAVKWNIEFLTTQNRMNEPSKIKSLEVVDDYTLKMNLTEVTSMSVNNYGWVPCFSPTSYQTNGVDWAKSHIVGMGPFMVSDWSPDTYINYKAYEGFFKGKPYLDGINYRAIPDSMAASAMIQSGEADYWYNVPIKYAVELASKGYKLNVGITGLVYGLFENTTSPDSRWNNKLLREALEYAIDRDGLVKAVGYGKYEALKTLAPKNSNGYDANYAGRPYNQDKARELIKEAGYPNGFETTILCTADTQNIATIIQADLAEVGITAKLDVADFARWASLAVPVFFGGGDGFDELCINMSGVDLPYTVSLIRHYGPEPVSGITSTNGAKSAAFLADCEKLYQIFDADELAAATKAAINQASEDAICVPLFMAPFMSVMSSKVHDDGNAIHGTIWNLYKTWIEK